ncbi:hypothetical protein RESH_03699 [Rhodopirellula europaea SH398]|uniref:Uncharacterized protein n=1 Tax=Rhodopirellula europaea SH398 TaxID=1263868 RepID=M5S248_9BACT|nr:hypothetical protein RESH_03699 [Rhodopirellula europaea SH398]
MLREVVGSDPSLAILQPHRCIVALGDTVVGRSRRRSSPEVKTSEHKPNQVRAPSPLTSFSSEIHFDSCQGLWRRCSWSNRLMKKHLPDADIRCLHLWVIRVD